MCPQRDLSVELLGHTLPAPVLLGPVGVQGIIHAESDLASARAAASLGVPFVLSTLSSRSMEDVAQAMERRASLVPTLLGKRSRIDCQPVAARRAIWLLRSRGYARHCHAGMARARSAASAPAVSSGPRTGQLFHRLRVPLPPQSKPPEGDPAAAIRLVGRSVFEHRADLARSRLAAPANSFADSAEGNSSPGRRAPRRWMRS